MASNQSYIEKADLSIANITSDGGILLADQAKEFYEILIDEATLLPFVTTVSMGSHSWELSKMGFTGEVLRRANENSGLPLADRVKPEFAKVSLVAKEFVAEARIPYTVVEDNVINGSFVQVAMAYLGKALSRDIEKLIIQGDTASSSLLLSSFDGILKKATSQVVNAGGVRLTKSVLKTAVQTMPSMFMQGKLAFLTSKNATIDYIDSLSNRQTLLGDDMLTRRAVGEYMGYPVLPVPLFPENIGTGNNKTNALLLDPKNIHVGFHREVRIETGRDISSRQFIIVATVRLDATYVHEPAVVKITEILATPG